MHASQAKQIGSAKHSNMLHMHTSCKACMHALHSKPILRQSCVMPPVLYYAAQWQQDNTMQSSQNMGLLYT
jgi:hypothetical protein